MILQSRDRELLRTCYEQQFMTYDQVLRYFFTKLHFTVGLRRLKKLERAGLIRRDPAMGIGGPRLIRLTDAGRKAIIPDIVVEVPQIGKPDLQTVQHDLAVTSVRLRLQELWKGAWFPERALKREDFPQIPDGLFLFFSGKRVAVEVENSIKNRPRLLALFERWRRVSVELVLYVATSETIFAHLKRCIADGPRMVPLALIRYQDLLGTDPSVWTPGGQVEVFTLKEY